MEIKAHVKYIRMSPRRIRLVADVLRGLSVEAAERQLFAIPRRASSPLQKLLHAAVANAEQNFDCVRENLYVKTITVDEGPVLKRFTPRAFGRATSIRKRSAHVTIALGEKEEGKKGGRARRETARAARHARHTAARAPVKESREKEEAPAAREGHRPQPVTPGRTATRHHVEGAKENVHGREKPKGFLKRLFNRKSG